MGGGSWLVGGKEAAVLQSPKMDLTDSEVEMAGIMSAIGIALLCIPRAVVQLAPCHPVMRWSSGRAIE